MSLKENIDMVKEELNSEEKFFEKAVITEKFVKKYKKLIIGSVVSIIVLVAANIGYSISKQNQITAANLALAQLKKDAKNSSSLLELKALSPKLYDVWIFSQAMANKDLETIKSLKNSKALIVNDLASYELAQSEQKSSDLNEYALKQNSIFKDLALVQSAVILMNENKIDKAREKLSTISANSSLFKLAQTLLHYGVK